MARFPTVLNDDDTETTLPYRWAICSHCDGHGQSSAYLGAFTREDIDELGQDFLEDYMAGGYDRTCEACEGSGKVAVVDRARCKPDLLARYDEMVEDETEMDAMYRAEMRMGC